MLRSIRNALGWATPITPNFDRASLSVQLGHERRTCLARKQGRCPGKAECADCAWVEGWTRASIRS